MSEIPFERLSRRGLFKASVGVVAGAAMARFAPRVEAHDLRPSDPAYRFARYESIVNRPGLRMRQIYEWPNIANPIIFANVRNGMNGAQFSYGISPEEMQVVIQAYASANAATYDDYVWNKFRMGEIVNVRDPSTGQPALRNIWLKSSVPANTVSSPPSSRDHPYYADVSIEGLQRRGVLYLT